MNISLNTANGFSVFAQKFGAGGLLKSTQEKIQRQQSAQGKIDFWENQKENLKSMECDSLEEISKKLEMFHSYEDQIAAAKKEYNSEQMWHTMDEAREIGEKIAEAAEKYAPKTEEERKEEMVEEALGTEENKSELLENLEDIQEEFSEMTEEGMTENLEELAAENVETVNEMLAENVEAVNGMPAENVEAVNGMPAEETSAALKRMMPESQWEEKYVPLDIRI